MAGKITMQHIGDRLGVSKYTVSQALSGKPGVSETKRRQIIALARTLGYRLPPESMARPADDEPAKLAAGSGSGAKTLLICMAKEHREEPTFWKRVLDGLYGACRDYGWSPHMVEPGDPVALAAGGIVVVGRVSVADLLALRPLALPTVLLDHEEPLIEADVILNANLEAARTACHHLLTAGCRRIVLIGRDSFAVSFKERWWGCRLAADEWRAKRPEEAARLTKWTIAYGGPPAAWETQLAKRLDGIAPGDEPDGILCANDQIALKLLPLLAARGIRVPGSCRVVGIDNITAAAGAEPPLTTVALAKEALGRRAIEALERKRSNPGSVSEKIILSARLIVRRSG
ncbi:LacI family DNA-binding transcriptional regulator [Paenibacillus cymbidii]|uniref:LacI family DNA-binding transcriptional regulator n=1 Tax=Paenibacillus cymbidii TaxID=1639034 RepID=UPI001081622E|nr:LacI family DNA-binding transcriptional regulator [Paenibacillus cymbidii]